MHWTAPILAIALTISLAVPACKPGAPIPIPAPMAEGKCVVSQYRRDVGAVQDCNYAGYSYHCEEGSMAKDFTCKLMGEAKGER